MVSINAQNPDLGALPANTILYYGVKPFARVSGPGGGFGRGCTSQNCWPDGVDQ